MKLKTLIDELEHIGKEYGEDTEVELQIAPGDADAETILGHPGFFIVPENYEDGATVNIRVWPY